MPHGRSHRTAVAVALGLALAVPAAFLSGPAASAAPTPAQPYDVNGDGFPELAASAGLGVGSVERAGGLVVLTSSGAGLTLGRQVLTQATAGVAGEPSLSGFWGLPSASADIDEDGYADLVVSGDTVLFGSRDGLVGARSYTVADGDGPRGGVAFGDFDADGAVDLAIGLPTADYVPGQVDRAPGAVRVFRGGGPRFVESSSYLLKGVRSGANLDVGFGSTLSAADLDGDGVTDLAVGSSGPGNPDDEGFAGPGSLSVCYGAASRDSTGCTQLVRDDRYAGADNLLVGNVTGGSRPEIVFGISYPEFNRGQVSKARRGGVVEIVSLSGSGSTTTATVVDVGQNSKGVRGTGETYDQFGSAVALGDLDRDGYDDLVVGAPGEADGKKSSSGRVTLVYGGKKGYRTSGGTILDQDTKGVPGKSEKRDRFGESVALLDHDGDGRLDLDVAAPGENDEAGSVTLLAGAGTSFAAKRSRSVTLKTLKIDQDSDAQPLFGYSLGG